MKIDIEKPLKFFLIITLFFIAILFNNCNFNKNGEKVHTGISEMKRDSLISHGNIEELTRSNDTLKIRIRFAILLKTLFSYNLSSQVFFVLSVIFLIVFMKILRTIRSIKNAPINKVNIFIPIAELGYCSKKSFIVSIILSPLKSYICNL